MKVLCVIAARGKSKRLPRKNIRKLLGKPLIAYTIESALGSKLCDKVVVSSDDRQIFRISEGYGIGVIRRPAALAGDSSPIDATLRHAVRHLSAKEGFRADIAVLLQANVPVRKKGEIDAVVRELLKRERATAVVTVYEVDQRPEWAKARDRKTGMLKPLAPPSRAYRKQDLPDLYLLDGAVIAVRVKTLMGSEGNTRVHAYMGPKVYPVIHDRIYAVEIDEPGDLALAEYYLRKTRKSR